MGKSNQINAIRAFFIVIFVVVGHATYAIYFETEENADTLYILYEQVDLNNIRKSSRTLSDNNDYPKDWGRTYNILIKNHLHVWFHYYNNLPSWSDLVFEYQVKPISFLDEVNVIDQNWFRNTSKNKIYKTFSGKDKVIYLVEKDKLMNGKATLIRVYFDVPEKE
ncbi:hypothetical protein [Marinoscillum furvescens]|uniref:Uncharacterized protein n=1 Tax=Marinoscillum furvescens DSM 4134 TaxID=1122208 RepID=A0A3D9KZI3_MARFU|nr:hypothetical protein [Marinoscillum furvescens]RED93824.1 hypothetical protein C7460_1232 [Marinoscillum furvescens DSM 4134]